MKHCLLNIEQLAVTNCSFQLLLQLLHKTGLFSLPIKSWSQLKPDSPPRDRVQQECVGWICAIFLSVAKHWDKFKWQLEMVLMEMDRFSLKFNSFCLEKHEELSLLCLLCYFYVSRKSIDVVCHPHHVGRNRGSLSSIDVAGCIMSTFTASHQV